MITSSIPQHLYLYPETTQVLKIKDKKEQEAKEAREEEAEEAEAATVASDD